MQLIKHRYTDQAARYYINGKRVDALAYEYERDTAAMRGTLANLSTETATGGRITHRASVTDKE